MNIDGLVVEEDLNGFVAKLPELSVDPPSVHLVMMAVRKRKARRHGIAIKDDLLVERVIIRPHRNWREKYLNSVRNLALLQTHGAYTTMGLRIPPEAIGILGTVSPRAVLPALSILLRENLDIMIQRQRDAEAALVLARQDARFFSALHRKRMKGTHFVTLDVDEPSLYPAILDLVEAHHLPVWMTTETSRGYHVILDLKQPQDAARFHSAGGLAGELPKFRDLHVQEDSQEPIPGTLYAREETAPQTAPHYVRIIKR